MVLAAFVLVLAAAATFAAGIATSRTSDSLVYVSILLSLAAFAILAIASIRARQAARVAGGDEDWDAARLRSLDTEAATGPLLRGLDENQLDMAPNWKRDARQRWRTEEPPAGAEADEELERELELEEDEADFEVPVTPVPVAAGLEDLEDEDEDWAPDDESLATAAYAVAGYEDEEVDEDEELDELEDIGGFAFGGRQREGPAAPEFREPAFDEIELDEEEEEDVLDVPEPAPVRRTPARRPVEAGSSGSALDLIDDYDDLTAAEIVPRLQDLDLESLRWVQRRERSGGKRTTILNQVDDLIADQGGGRRTRATKSTAKKASTRTKKAAPKKAAPRKTTAKKAAKKTSTRAKKAATRTKKTAAKKTTAKRTSKSSRRG